ncbi:sugar transporter SWEET1-like [Coccinella septempunctata]|uniref:sugar transporter SWEET1-like n=1 Tax=Coccinella septempunctata TaxID=41139 RepID=UPI001D0923BB|nr:sugar transporter SWEET1-like [Coccinella septempunctata]
MESLHNQLLPYKELVGSIASVVTIAQFFSGAVMCRDIHKRQTTKGVSAVPFVGAVIIGILVFKYGLLLNDDAMLRVNVASVTLNMCYIAVFLYYCENSWEEVYKPASFGILLVAIILGYAEWESSDKIEYRYGLLVTILQLLLLASPLRDLANIIATKDASSIPFPLAFMAAIVTFLWFIYAIILNNIFMLVQNFIGFVLCIVQLSLVFIYGSHLE